MGDILNRKPKAKKTRKMFTNEYRLKAVRRIRQLQRQHPSTTIKALCKQVGISPFNYSNWAKMHREGVFKNSAGAQMVNRKPGVRSKGVRGTHELTLIIANGTYELEVKSADFKMNQSGIITSGKTLRQSVEDAFFSKLGH